MYVRKKIATIKVYSCGLNIYFGMNKKYINDPIIGKLIG
jgi:hypothetical protein